MTAKQMEYLESAARKEMAAEDEKVIKDYIKRLLRRKHEATREWISETKYVRAEMNKIQDGKLTAEEIRQFFI